MTPNFPLVGLGSGSESGIDFFSLFPPAHAPATSQSSVPDIFGKATGALGKIYNAATANSFLGLLFGSDYQYLTGIIGLVLIIGGIFLFKPVRETVVNVSKTAAKGAAIAA